MDVSEAVRAAKDHIKYLFAEEGARHIGLEEVRYDDASASWYVTIGFQSSIPLERADTRAAVILRDIYGDRRFKVVHLSDRDGRILAVSDRILEAAE